MLTTRPLNENEIKILKKEKKQLEKGTKSNLRFLYIYNITALIIGTIAFFILNSKTEYYLLAGTVVIYILIGFWIFIERNSSIKKATDNIAYVLTKNVVESLKVISNKYIELPEVEDEGTFYLFQIENNKILSIGGQDYHSTKRFPSNDFEIAISRGKKGEIVLYEKYVNGNKIQPIRKITGKEKFELIGRSKYPNPESFTIIEGELEQIELILT